MTCCCSFLIFSENNYLELFDVKPEDLQLLFGSNEFVERNLEMYDTKDRLNQLFLPLLSSYQNLSLNDHGELRMLSSQNLSLCLYPWRRTKLLMVFGDKNRMRACGNERCQATFWTKINKD